MDLRKLKTLIDLVSESNISELEITEADGKVRIVKADPHAPSPPMMMIAPTPVPMAAAPPARSAAAIAADEAEAAAIAAAETGHIVKSPMVGTFYRAASPGGKALVEIGSTIKSGEPVCIIEAMKIMNEIEAEITGVVREISVEDSQPVEFGQVLFRVDPNG